MTAKLFCKTGQLAGASFEVANEATIGKNAENTIQLYPGLISGRHARIVFDEKMQCYSIQDLNSRNGTRLDGARVRGKERLGKLHVITFANTFDFLFQVVEGAQQPTQQEAQPAKPQPAKEQVPVSYATPLPNAEESKTQCHQDFAPLPEMKQDDERKQKTIVSSDFFPLPEIKPEADLKQKTAYDDGAFVLPQIEAEVKDVSTPAQPNMQRTKIGVEFTPAPSFVEPSKSPRSSEPMKGSFVLVFETMKDGPKAFDIKEGSTIVGRESSCAIFLDDGSVSRKHAEFMQKGNTLTLKDLGSKNHTFIDNRKISTEVEVNDGMEVGFGLRKARLVRKPGS